VGGSIGKLLGPDSRARCQFKNVLPVEWATPQRVPDFLDLLKPASCGILIPVIPCESQKLIVVLGRPRSVVLDLLVQYIDFANF
jgi:hypothetical protein